MKRCIVVLLICLSWVALPLTGICASGAFGDRIYDPGKLKPKDSALKVKTGEKAPGFTLPAISGKTVSLSDYQGRKNVLLTFIPAAWTPVCSDQWPGYNIAEPLFDAHDTVILGISTDNIPSLYAWTREMGDLWFDVLSDFWPHGKTADQYGILRNDGTAERAIFLIDKTGVIQFIHVSDINRRPDLEIIVRAMEKLPGK